MENLIKRINLSQDVKIQLSFIEEKKNISRNYEILHEDYVIA